MGCFGARWTATRKASLEWTCLCTRYQEKGSRYKGPQWTYSEHVCVPKWKNAWRYQWTISQNQGCDTTGHSEHVCVPCETRSRPSQTRIAMKNAHRRFWKAETYENYHAKPIQGHPGQRKVWELSRKIDIEEVEEPEATRMTTQSCPQPSIRPSQNTEEHENYHKKCTSKSRRSWKTGNTTRIAKPNPDPTTAANPKARELPRKMKSKHESTRITVRNLRCNPAFFP